MRSHPAVKNWALVRLLINALEKAPNSVSSKSDYKMRKPAMIKQSARLFIFLSLLAAIQLLTGCIITRYAVTEHVEPSSPSLVVWDVDQGSITVVLKDKTRDLKNLKILKTTLKEVGGDDIPLEFIPGSLMHDGSSPIRADEGHVSSVGCRYALVDPSNHKKRIKRPDSPFIVTVQIELDGQIYSCTGTFSIRSKWTSFFKALDEWH